MEVEFEYTNGEGLDWDVYPAGKRTKNMILGVNKTRCKGCSICVEICPYDALFMGDDITIRGYIFPLENGKCVGCRQCVWACPDFALTVQKLRDVAIEQ